MGSFAVTVPRVSNSLRAGLILNNINNTAAQLLQIQSQLSSGLRISKPSDDPFDATVAGHLQSFLEQKERFQKNIENALSVLNTADSTLSQSSNLVTRAHSIGLEEIGVTATSETRRSAAAVIDEILSEMVTLANSSFAGRYIFAGRNTLEAPFVNLGTGVYFGGDTGEVAVSIDYSSYSATSVDAAGAFGAVSCEIRGTADLDPRLTVDIPLDELNRSAGVNPGSVTISDGFTSSTVDLSGAATTRDVIAAMNAGTPATTTCSINAAGSGIEITTTLPGGSLSVDNTLGGSTATDLGIYFPAPVGAVLTGLDTDPDLTAFTPTSAITAVDWASGIVITNNEISKTIDLSSCNTLQDVLNKINTAGLYVEASINESGNGIDVKSRLSGSSLTIGENGGATASDLGIRSLDVSTRLADLNSGLGVNTVSGDDITVTLKDSTSFGVDLSAAVTIADVIAAINSAPGNPGTLAASLASNGNGIVLTDTSGGAGALSVDRANLSAAASDLGILASTSTSVIAGDDVNPVTTNGVFSHLLGLREALLADDDRLVSLYTGKLETDLPRILEKQASIGARQQRIETVKDRISSEVIELKSMLSDRIDLDYTSSIVRLSTLQASFEAGLQTAGVFLQMSLIDFLR